MYKIFLGTSLIIVSLYIMGVRVYKGVILKQHVTGHLKRAGDANTIDLAKKELEVVIKYLENHQLTEGYTSIFIKTPEEDISFWYQNLVSAKKELDDHKRDSSLEKTNLLMKLRETLIDEGEKTKVTIPPGLSVFPHNKMWAALMSFALLAGFLGLMLVIPEDKTNTKNTTDENIPLS